MDGDFFFPGIGSAEYMENIYREYQKNPSGIDPLWRSFFRGMEFAKESGGKKEETTSLRLYRWVEAFRTYGHLVADIDPIAIRPRGDPESLSWRSFGFTSEEEKIEGPLKTVGEVEARWREIYCRRIGFEYMHIYDEERKDFLRERIEGEQKPFSVEEKKYIFRDLLRAEEFERFIHTKYVGQKRFSLEGLESCIPVLRAVLDAGGEEGAEEALICMAHRGRLNVLANIFEKPYAVLFHEFGEGYEPGDMEGSGDVKYHKGFSSDITTPSGKKMHVSIPPNSSHLESVNAVMQGQARAKQVHKKDLSKEKILPIQIHGDASVAGQGVIYEVLQFYKLKGFETGGSLHIILDNQIGFTTSPTDGRSTVYPSDIAKTFDCPVFHVNAEDPEACIRAAKLAVAVRQKFKCDVFLHLNGYRKYGHNEGDEPAYTQPLEYRVIREKPSVRHIYEEKLISSREMSKEEAEKILEEYRQSLADGFEESKSIGSGTRKMEDFLGNRWNFWKDFKLKKSEDFFRAVDTSVDPETLKHLAVCVTRIPEGFSAHKKIAGSLAARRSAVTEHFSENSVDWGLAENLAYASILEQGYPVRLSGQDCCRGTFSHRHALLVDQESGEEYFPMQHIGEEQGLLTVYNSPLSEYGCLGFEYGYSISTPKGLVIWEAQFGDFSDGAQIIIDAYIAASEEKWNRLSDLVLLLPHGYEGQGPEHSSARPERYLQLTGNDNMQVVIPSTPAQLFHLLRRQVLKGFRKPLIVFTPKGLLRHKSCVSSPQQLSEGGFAEILDDSVPGESVTTLVFCGGKIFYDLSDRRAKEKKESIAFIRIEQLYPFHRELLKKILQKYPHVKKYAWIQEEPKNMGAWSYVAPLLREAVSGEVVYYGRPVQASPATGSHKRHKIVSEKISEQLFKEAL